MTAHLITQYQLHYSRIQQSSLDHSNTVYWHTIHLCVLLYTTTHRHTTNCTVAWLMLQEKIFCLQVAKSEVRTLLLTLFLENLWHQNSTKLHGLPVVSCGSNTLKFHRLVLSPSPDHQCRALNKTLANRVKTLWNVGRFEQLDMGVILNRF